jgi:zinc protease
MYQKNILQLASDRFLDDLECNLSRCKEFFNKWYVPNNVTLVISGDFEPTKKQKN